MRPGWVAVDLKIAMRQPGCPICRIRDEAEYKYLYYLLWENVNDGATRMQIVASLGFCPRHTWQMGRIETERFGDALGNSIIYESLTGVVHNRLASYLRRSQADERSKWRRLIDHFLRRPRRPPFPDEIQPEAECRVCRMRKQTEESNLQWLMQGLADSQPDFREWYTQSDKLCFQHLRRALELGDGETQAGAMFLARDAVERLEALRADLEGFGGKRAWDRRFEAMTDGEKESWRQALRFFGGNERTENGKRPK